MVASTRQFMAVSLTPLGDEQRPEHGLLMALKTEGIEPLMVTSGAMLDAIMADEMPDLALIDLGSMSAFEFTDCVRRSARLKLPTIALVPEGQVAEFDEGLGVDDFILSPPAPNELVVRARRVLGTKKPPESGEVVRVGDLIINAANYEVSVQGSRANLRFKEYELLLLMASNPGRVYTRETLLNRIWGYDYLGGTRTVDVHIRRLRSKIEDADHSFIETVWNVGYRFRDTGLPS
jgi:DNA-binding response OmpR family regulator